MRKKISLLLVCSIVGGFAFAQQKVVAKEKTKTIVTASSKEVTAARPKPAAKAAPVAAQSLFESKGTVEQKPAKAAVAPKKGE